MTDPVMPMLNRLFNQMQAEMEANRFKGERWRGANLSSMEHELLYHVVKLLHAARAVGQPASDAVPAPLVAVREYAADVANCAGILADSLGAWDEQPALALGNQDQGYVPESRELLRGEADRMLRTLPPSAGLKVIGEPPADGDIFATISTSAY